MKLYHESRHYVASYVTAHSTHIVLVMVQKPKAALRYLKVKVILYFRHFYFFFFFFWLRSYIKIFVIKIILVFYTGNTSNIAFTYNFNSIPLWIQITIVLLITGSPASFTAWEKPTLGKNMTYTREKASVYRIPTSSLTKDVKWLTQGIRERKARIVFRSKYSIFIVEK